MKTGVYAISSPSGKRYIGSARDLIKRKKQHFAALDKGRHHSRALQRAWNKYGNLTFSVLLICAEKDLFLYEQLLLDKLRPAYNISPSANGTRGMRWTEDAKARIKGRKAYPELIRAGILASTTPEQRRSRAQSARAQWTGKSKQLQISKLTGRKQSVETKAKRSASMMGHSVSEETRQKLAGHSGWSHTEEAKEKMRRHKRSSEHRAALSRIAIGNKNRLGMAHSEETKEKISLALRGRRIPDDVRWRMSVGQRLRLKRLNCVPVSD